MQNRKEELNFCYHGTSFELNRQSDFNKIKPLLVKVNDIYEKYGIYRCFESKIKEENQFWITSSIQNCVFYTYQAPEFLARFASRSDYYKWDGFFYDRQAFYRKDFSACLQNCITEMEQYNFAKSDMDVVKENFNKIWKHEFECMIQPQILFIDYKQHKNFECVQQTTIQSSSYEELLNYVVENKYYSMDFEDAKILNLKVYLLPIDKFLEKEEVTENQKFVCFNNKKYIPDFYVIGRFAPKKVYSFENYENVYYFQNIKRNVEDNELEVLADILMNYHANTKLAKKF